MARRTPEVDGDEPTIADQIGNAPPVPADPVPDTVDADKVEAAKRGELSATQVSAHADENDVIDPPGYVETISRAFPGTQVVSEA